MFDKKISAILILAALFGSDMAIVADAADAADAPSAPLSAADRSDIIATLGSELKTKYVFPDVADHVVAQLAAKSAHGDYAAAGTTTEFAVMLTHDLREFGKDAHFRVSYRPDFHPHADDDAPPSAEELEKQRAMTVQWGYGVARVERLPGNVGYIDLRGFGETEFVQAAYTQAMALLAGTDAMIIDLRRNGGGDPDSVAYFMSQFFAPGDERHLNDIYNRPKNTTREYWTNPAAGPRYTKPLYVLTSPRTFSGGEECAYDFQTQKRATLIGEVTGGGANPGQGVALGHGLVAFVPTGRAINPITHTNWEHVGVTPDVEVPAKQAYFTAYATILRALLPKAANPNEKEEIERALGGAEKGEDEQVDYSRMH